MEIGKTFCGRTDGRTDGRTHLSSNLLGHRRGDDLIITVYASLLSIIVFFKTSGQSNLTTSLPHTDGSVVFDWLRKCAAHLIHGSLDSPDLAF